jgi:Gpi18-like mannosyltransferase
MNLKPTPASSRRVSTWLIVASIVLATILKIYCASTTYGTNDTGLFQFYGQVLYEAGLQETYAASQHFNHTPALSMVLIALYWLAKTFSWYYPLLLRLPGIAADVAASLMFWRLAARHMPGRISTSWVCLFALNPVSFMVSGYHGQFDSVIALFIFLAAYQCFRGEVELCAFFYALAVHVKIAPLILSPVFFFYWYYRGKGLRFFVITNSLLFAVWIIPLLEYPKIFLHNVFGYGSYWGIWGITYWLSWLPWPQMRFVSFYDLFPVQNEIMTALKIVIVAGILILAWKRSNPEPDSIFETLSYAWAIFFVFAPGALPYYLVWPSCIMLVHSRRYWAFLLAANSVFLFRSYTVINNGFPWNKGLFTVHVLHKWIGWSNLSWMAYVIFLGYFAVKALQAAGKGTSHGPQQPMENKAQKMYCRPG